MSHASQADDHAPRTTRNDPTDAPAPAPRPTGSAPAGSGSSLRFAETYWDLRRGKRRRLLARRRHAPPV